MDSDIIKQLIADNKRSTVIDNEKMYVVTFTYGDELQNSFRCRKDSKKLYTTYFIPKSIIKSMYAYSVIKHLPEEAYYEKKRVAFLLPEWYCSKTLKFYA